MLEGYPPLTPLTITQAVYTTLSDIPFKVPTNNPGPTPDISVNAMGAQIEANTRAHKENFRIWREYMATDKALKQQLLSAIQEMYCKALRHQSLGTLPSPPDTLSHTYMPPMATSHQQTLPTMTQGSRHPLTPHSQSKSSLIKSRMPSTLLPQLERNTHKTRLSHMPSNWGLCRCTPRLASTLRSLRQNMRNIQIRFCTSRAAQVPTHLARRWISCSQVSNL
jgi:hypothetical protein